MPLEERIRKNWIAIQQKHAVPVNALGLRIDPRDEKTLKVWREEGLRDRKSVV